MEHLLQHEFCTKVFPDFQDKLVQLYVFCFVAVMILQLGLGNERIVALEFTPTAFFFWLALGVIPKVMIENCLVSISENIVSASFVLTLTEVVVPFQTFAVNRREFEFPASFFLVCTWRAQSFYHSGKDQPDTCLLPWRARAAFHCPQHIFSLFGPMCHLVCPAVEFHDCLVRMLRMQSGCQVVITDQNG